jgi:uncharacterized membrane protein
MTNMIKILHIDPDYQATYFIYSQGTTIRTSVPLETAIELLKKEDFDLILSEPHNKAILKKEKPDVKAKAIELSNIFFKKEEHGDFREVRPN